MLKHPTLDQLHALGLHGMAKAFAEIAAGGEADGLGHHEWLGASARSRGRPGGRTSASRRACASPNCASRPASRMSIIARPRGLDRALFQKLVEGEWIDAHDNLALIGPTGVGKSWLSAALGHKACRDNRSVLYQRVPRLFEDLALARGDGRHPRLLRNLGRADLLILDDWGLEPLDAAARHDLLEILEERYGTPLHRHHLVSFPSTDGTKSSAEPNGRGCYESSDGSGCDHGHRSLTFALRSKVRGFIGAVGARPRLPAFRVAGRTQRRSGLPPRTSGEHRNLRIKTPDLPRVVYAR